MTSIRRGMLFLLLIGFLAVWVLTAILVVLNVRDQVSGALDGQLRQAAYFTWMRAAQSKGRNFEDIETLPQYMADSFGQLDSFAFQIWDGQRLLVKSDNAPPTRMSSRPGFKDGRLDGRPWRFYYRVDAFEGLDVVLGVENRFSGDVAKAVAWSVTWPMALAVVLIAAVSFWGVSVGLSPLHRLATQIDARTPTAMDPIDERKVPQEVETLVRALNELLRRLNSAMEAERRFNANASHELRTPLAAIEVQSKVALDAETAEERVSALNEIRHNVHRGRQLIEQLLTIARLDPDRASREFEAVNLKALVSAEISEIWPKAEEKSIDLSLDSPDRVELRASAYGLSILVRNLLDNAVRYTPEGGAVGVRLEAGRDAVVLQIEDSGPGIAPDKLDKVFDRFYRAVGTPGSGAGLGLSIAAKIAQLHRTNLVLDNREKGGLVARLTLPKHPSDAPQA